MTVPAEARPQARRTGVLEKPQPSDASRETTGAIRKKRGAYISKACHECRRRKSKCDGKKPCTRCAKHGLACAFPPQPRHDGGDDNDASAATRLLQQRVAWLEEQLRASNLPGIAIQSSSPPLYGSPAQHRRGYVDASASVTSPTPWVQKDHAELVQTLHSPGRAQLLPNVDDNAPSDPLPTALPTNNLPTIDNQTQPPPGQSPGFVRASTIDSPYSVQQHGSLGGDSTTHTTATATAHYKFNFNLAQTHLAARGISHTTDQARTSAMPTREPSPMRAEIDQHPECDPLWMIDKVEALRLCGVYEEEIGLTYPFLDIDRISSHVGTIYDALDAGRRSGFGYMPLRDNAILPADDLKIAKMVLACALVIETSGSSALAGTLFHNVKDSVQGSIWGDDTISSITVYTLCAIWLFLADNDFLAWRIAGIVARWCLELGLNKSLYLGQMIIDDHDRKMAVRLFWSIQTLDRRWSFGSGLPFVIRDEDIDQSFPMPDDDVPYLQAMVEFNQIVSDVWCATYSTPVDFTTRKDQETSSYLAYRISKWWDELPITLQFGRGDLCWSRGAQRQRILLYLRKCQLTILLQQPVLHCESRIRQRPGVARGVVETAKDVIRRLNELNRTTDIYHTQQMCFNHFLILALGVIFLAVSQAPSEFAPSVREEFNAALDLVQQLSFKSYVSRRLWKTIRGLRQIGDSLGVSRPDAAANGEANGVANTSRPLANPRSGPTFDPGIFLLEHDLQCHFMLEDDPINGQELTENMNAVFEAMEKDHGGFLLDPLIEAGPDAEISDSHANPWHGQANRDVRTTTYANQNVSSMLVGMIGGT